MKFSSSNSLITKNNNHYQIYFFQYILQRIFVFYLYIDNYGFHFPHFQTSYNAYEDCYIEGTLNNIPYILKGVKGLTLRPDL